MALHWGDFREIGEALLARFGAVNPLTIRFTDMHKSIMELEGFEDPPSGSNEKILEAIQMAWYEEWQDEYGGD